MYRGAGRLVASTKKLIAGLGLRTAGALMLHAAKNARQSRFTGFHDLAQCRRTPKNVPRGHGSNNLSMSDRSQSHGRMQPHCEQSGVPPNWHGSTFVRRSAESERVVLAKMQ